MNKNFTMKELGEELAKRKLTLRLSATNDERYRAVVLKDGGRSLFDGGGFSATGDTVETAIIAALQEENDANVRLGK
jgi:hypothetical protein